MKITLYMAISADGFIATKDGDSDWVSESDIENFNNHIQEKGCIIVGRTTFEQYLNDLYPVEDVTNIVISSQQSTYEFKNVLVATSPAEAVKLAERYNHSECLLVGGGKTNTAFLEAGLIDDIILSVHPLLLKDGIRLFEGYEDKITLKKTGLKDPGDDLIHLYYKVIK